MKTLRLIILLCLFSTPAWALIFGPSGSGTVYAPNAPTLTSVSSASSTSLSLVWAYGSTDAGHSAATSVNVYRGTSAGTESGTPVATGVTASPWTDTGLTTGQTYYYLLKGVNSAGPSVYSVEKSATPTATVYAPSAPTIGTATAGNASATVAFTAGAVDGTHSAATSYTATSTPGSITGTGTSSPITVSGLTNGTAYTFAVTASNTAGPSAASAASNSVTPTAGSGLLDFETASLTPTGLSPAYTNEVPANAVRDNTVAHGGSYSMKFTSQVSPRVQLSRQVTFPTSGTLAFERWFKFNSIDDNDSVTLFGVAPDSTVSTWNAVAFVSRNSGITPVGFGYYTNNLATRGDIYPYGSFTLGAWYKVHVDFNCANDTYSAYLYNAAGTQVASFSNVAVSTGTVRGTTKTLILGRAASSIVWFDDLLDGI